MTDFESGTGLFIYMIYLYILPISAVLNWSSIPWLFPYWGWYSWWVPIAWPVFLMCGVGYWVVEILVNYNWATFSAP